MTQLDEQDTPRVGPRRMRRHGRVANIAARLVAPQLIVEVPLQHEELFAEFMRVR
jgi:hypothetical protein